MILLVGLGNPGREYAGHRHNIGFMAIDAIASAHNVPPPRQRFQGECAEGRLGAERAILLKPMTFMNDSGRSVGEARAFYKLSPADVVVFHDELDLAPGKLKMKRGGGHAGHNGLRSIDAHLGPDYRRVRLGIGHPGDRARVSGYVLHDFAKADRDWLEPLLGAIAAQAPLLAQLPPGSGDALFATRVAETLTPPRPKLETPKLEKPKSDAGKPEAAEGG